MSVPRDRTCRGESGSKDGRAGGEERSRGGVGGCEAGLVGNALAHATEREREGNGEKERTFARF